MVGAASVRKQSGKPFDFRTSVSVADGGHELKDKIGDAAAHVELAHVGGDECVVKILQDFAL